MGADSVFLDIGSGYGRCVVHARLRCGVKKSVGIEAVATRHVEAERMMRVHLPNQLPSLFRSGRLQWDKSMQLLEGDATHLHVRSALLAATHVYMFDWLFKEEALSIILSVLTNSPRFRVLVSCQKLDRVVMQKWGGDFHQLSTLTLHTARGQHSPNVYVYTLKAYSA